MILLLVYRREIFIAKVQRNMPITESESDHLINEMGSLNGQTVRGGIVRWALVQKLKSNKEQKVQLQTKSLLQVGTAAALIVIYAFVIL